MDIYGPNYLGLCGLGAPAS